MFIISALPLNDQMSLNMYQHSHHGEFCGRCFFCTWFMHRWTPRSQQIHLPVVVFSHFNHIYLKVNSDLLLRVWAFYNNVLRWIWMNGDITSYLLCSAVAASNNWLVMVVLTSMASGKERLGAVQSICCAWMFDEGGLNHRSVLAFRSCLST